MLLRAFPGGSGSQSQNNSAGVGGNMTRRKRGFAQRLLALSSFGFCRPTRFEFTQGRLDVSATSSNNPFVAAGVAIAKPE
ncbi:unnamed protein product, partial [Ascophyllum nodosum]